MTTDRAVMQGALDALSEASLLMINGSVLDQHCVKAIAALRQALAQPVPDVAAVMQERDELRFQRDLSRELMREQAARIAELEQGQDALDAKRYQWLRARLPGSAYRIAGVIYSEGGSGVDMAIDAAMGTQPAPATAPACFMCHGTGEHAMPVAIPAGVKAPTPIIVKCRQCKGAQP